MSKTRGVFGQRIANVTLSALLVATSIFTAVPFLLSSGVAAVPIPGLTTVSGNTAAGENQPGWMFGRDASTQTPFEFNTDEASIGDGALYVAPINGTNRLNKMVAENFIGSEIDDINSISFDYKIGAGGDAADARQFYMNVYANFAASPATKFYDCRYDVVATLDATSAFQTVTFDPLANYTVARSGSAPEPTCPTSPAAMGEGAFIRMFSLNVGDTSVSDAGLDGYLDNVVVQSTAGTTVYDFEAPYVDVTGPTFAITTPANGSYVAGSGNLAITATVTDESGIKKLLITVPTKSGNRTFTWEDGKANALVQKVGDNFTVTVDAAQLNEGPVYVVMRGTDNAGNTRYWNNNASLRQHSFIVDATAPSSFAITTPANGSTVRGVQTINAQISDPSDIRKVLMTVPLKTGNKTFVWEAGKTNNSLTRDGVNFSVTLDTNLMNDGERFVVLRATDGVGNTRYWNNNANIRQHSFVVDNTRPVATLVTPVVDSVNPTEIVVSASDNLGLNLVTANLYDVTNTTLIASCSAALSGNLDYVLTCPINPALADGVYTIRANARDAANRISETTVRTFTIDRTAPAVTVTTPVAAEAGSSVTFQGTVAGDFASLILTLNGVDYVVSDIQSDGSWSLAVDTTGLVPQIYTATVVAVDAAGNRSTEEQITFTVTQPEVLSETDEPGSTDVPGTDVNEPRQVARNNQTPTIVGPAAANGDVLGNTSDDEIAQNGSTDVEGIDTVGQAVDVDSEENQGTFAGLAWYWWLLILAGIAAIIAGIVRALRGRSA